MPAASAGGPEPGTVEAWTRQRTDNPCTRSEGLAGPGMRCGFCGRLSALWIERGGGARQTVYFCTLNGEAKRVTWPACGRFVEADMLAPDDSPVARSS